MRQRIFFTIILLATTVSVCSAGTINKGVWSPSGCGAEPVLPAINQTTVDGYNKSVKTINDWQQKVSTYSSCVVKEANDDNASIAKSANERQMKLQSHTEKVHADTEAAKAKLDKSDSK
ncbi:MAG: hypothetical protein LUO95_12840 [Methylococcaceae bacterium]|nr:hypothetical protein [Methylococcaceae bacterium]